MRGMTGRRAAALILGLVAVFALIAGCTTSVYSGMPRHIQTVEVHIFQNKTMYKGIEAQVTRGIIDRINADPHVRVSSNGGDALITGEITNVRRTTLRETTTNEPGTVLISIEATYSFYDNVEGRYIVEDATLSSTDTGISPGIYEASRGGDSQQGERGAAKALAAEIVRRTVGMW